jgi:hypothetical protein
MVTRDDLWRIHWPPARHCLRHGLSHPDDKQITGALVKNDFRKYRRIRTVLYDGKRLLPFDNRGAALDRLVGIGPLRRSKPLIAGDQLLQCLVTGEHFPTETSYPVQGTGPR